MNKIDKSDLLIFGGLVSLVGGIAMIHIPSAAIALGLILLVIGAFSSLPSKR